MALIVALPAGLAGCSPFMATTETSKASTVSRVSLVEVYKSDRRLHLYDGDELVADYPIKLGFEPVGHKLERGDGKTPVGMYHVDRRNPYSLFTLSLGLSYPNKIDLEMAAARGVNPGGDIFIHGQANKSRITRNDDWTEGCIALSNEDMEVLFQTVDIGTPVHVYH